MQMKDIKPSTNYSKDACRNRFEALENDTASIPPELDDDPERRAILREVAKRRAEKNVAKRRVERAEELGNVRAVNGTSKRTHAAVTETPATSSRVDNTLRVRNSLPVNYVVDVSDEGSSLSDLDSIFGDSSASSGDEVLFPGKPTGLLSGKVRTRDDLESLAIRSKKASKLQANPESLFSLVANINSPDPGFATPQNKVALISSKHQTSRRQRHSTQQEDTRSTGSEAEAVIQGVKRFPKVPAHEECTESLTSSGDTTKSRNTSEIPTVTHIPRDSARATTSHTNQCSSTVASPASSGTSCSGASGAGEQTPLSLTKKDTSPSIAAQLLLGLRNRDLVEEATNDQTSKRVEAERTAAMGNRRLSIPELEKILRSKDSDQLKAACHRQKLKAYGKNELLMHRLVDQYNRGYSRNDPIYTLSSPEGVTNLETTGGSQQGGSVNNPIRVQDPAEGEVSPEATDQSQRGHARKRSRISAPTTEEGIAVRDFASLHDSGRIELGQRREETPLPHIGYGFDPSEEYEEAKATRDKKQGESLAEELRQRKKSGPPTANVRETRRGLGGIDTDQNPSRTLRNPNVAPQGILPRQNARAILPKPAPGYPGARHQLAPPLRSEFNPSNFPTPEYNLALTNQFLRQRGYRDTPDPNATAPGPRAGHNTEAREQVHADYNRGTIPARSENVPQSGFTFPSTTADWQQPSADDHTMTYTPASQPYGASILTMRQSGPYDPAMTYTTTAQRYGVNDPSMGQSGGNDPTSTYTPTPQPYGASIPTMAQSGSYDPAPSYMSNMDEWYGVENPNFGQFGAVDPTSTYMPTPQPYRISIPTRGQSGSYGPTSTYTPTPQLYGASIPTTRQSGPFDPSTYTPTPQLYGASIPTTRQSGPFDPSTYTPTPQLYGASIPTMRQSGPFDPSTYTPTPQLYGASIPTMRQSGPFDPSTYTPTPQLYGASIPTMRQSGPFDPSTYTPTPQLYGASIPTMRQSGPYDPSTYTPTPQDYGLNIPITRQSGPYDPSTYTPTPQDYGLNIPITRQSDVNDPSMIDMPQLYATNNPSMGEVGANYPTSTYTSMPAPQQYGLNISTMGQSGVNDPSMIDMPQVYATNNPTTVEAVEHSLRTLNSPAPQFFESNSPVRTETVTYDPTMTDTPTPEHLAIDNPRVAGNVRDPTPQPQQRTQAQPNIPSRRPSAIDQRARPMHPPSGGLYPTTQAHSNITSPNAPAPGGSARSRASHRGRTVDVTGTQASSFGMLVPSAPQPSQPSTASPTFGVLKPNTGVFDVIQNTRAFGVPQTRTREERRPLATYHRLRISGLPYRVTEDDINTLVSPHVYQSMNLSQVRMRRIATVYFEDPFAVEAAALQVDGKVLDGCLLGAERVDLSGNTIPIGQ